ncbi:nitroreductase family protein [Clostridium sp. JN-9]|uniref:nitroreductase family protein n=1 Tax=Clostridium sp. JN-9 TaxID=2507159 RepID=UPI000FFE31E8|nr:nitroreductase family protein [Clostridium sp. JN-9]QAT39657.1 nitroreductase [Clostridium sp. JN-9]
MDYFELVQKRHSVRAYKSTTVEREKLDKILETARLAPTAANRQGFKIIVISTEGKKEELKKIYNSNWFVEAPYVICICSIPEKCWVRRDNKNYSDVDAAIVMDHIVYAATALGLGTCWVGAFDVEAAKNILELDSSLHPIAFTPIGYEKESPYRRMRRPLEELVIYK